MNILRGSCSDPIQSLQPSGMATTYPTRFSRISGIVSNRRLNTLSRLETLNAFLMRQSSGFVGGKRKCSMRHSSGSASPVCPRSAADWLALWSNQEDAPSHNKRNQPFGNVSDGVFKRIEQHCQ